jgi:hypothetical protein
VDFQCRSIFRAAFAPGSYSADRLRALRDRPPFSLRELRPMKKPGGPGPYFGEDFLWVLLATTENPA